MDRQNKPVVDSSQKIDEKKFNSARVKAKVRFKSDYDMIMTFILYLIFFCLEIV
jgi:hypothetical protein